MKKNSKTNTLVFSDIYGFRRSFLTILIPILVLLSLSIYMLVSYIVNKVSGSNEAGHKLANMIIFIMLTIVFIIPELFFVYLPYRDLYDSAIEPVKANIVSINHGFIEVVYVYQNKIMRGFVRGCFAFHFRSFPFYRGEVIKVGIVNDNQAVLLSGKGAQKFFPEEEREKGKHKAKESFGLKKRLFLSSLPYMALLILGLASLILCFLLQGVLSDKIILLILGLALILVPSYLLGSNLYTLQKELNQHISKPGTDITIQVAFVDEKRIDAIFLDPHTHKKERAPLILQGGKKLKAAVDYPAFINEDGEVFLLEPKKETK